MALAVEEIPRRVQVIERPNYIVEIHWPEDPKHMEKLNHEVHRLAIQLLLERKKRESAMAGA